MNDPWVAQLREKGLIDGRTASRLDELETRAHVPLARELHALLYAGAVLVLLGVGAAVKDRLNRLGPATVAAGLAAGSLLCLYYCLRTARPYSADKVDPPTVAYDYVLYLGCGLAGVFLSYIEWKWKALGPRWDAYLLVTGLLSVVLAYRCDNRLVLSVGLTSLMTWAGLQIPRLELGETEARAAAFTAGAVLLAAGEASRRGGVKGHFDPVYHRLGVNLALLALLLGPGGFERPELWLLLTAAGALGAWGVRVRRFETLAFTLVYAYLGVVVALLKATRGSGSEALVVAVSSGAVALALLAVRRSFREAA